MLAYIFDTKEEKGLVSILFMTYNHEAYVEDALKALMVQEYPMMELIVLDDASSDNTVGVIESYMGKLEEKFNRIVKIYHESNTGNVSKNQNELVINAHGEYIVGLSGDDAYMYGAIGNMVNILKQYQDCGMAYANMQPVGFGWSYGDEITQNGLWIKNQVEGVQNHMFERLMRENIIAAPTAIVRRKVYEKYGLHDESIMFEDYEYWLRISRAEKVYYSNKPVVYYRFSYNSISNYGIDKTNKKLQICMDNDYLVKKKYCSFLREEQQILCWREYFDRYMNACKNRGYEEGIKQLKEKMDIHGIKLETRDNPNNLLKRKKSENKILYSWLRFKNNKKTFKKFLVDNHIDTVGIYGFANLGRQLYEELVAEDISVSYVIDKMGNMLNTNIEIKTLMDELIAVDAVFITVLGLSENEFNDIRIATKSRLIPVEMIFRE